MQTFNNSINNIELTPQKIRKALSVYLHKVDNNDFNKNVCKEIKYKEKNYVTDDMRWQMNNDNMWK